MPNVAQSEKTGHPAPSPTRPDAEKKKTPLAQSETQRKPNQTISRQIRKQPENPLIVRQNPLIVCREQATRPRSKGPSDPPGHLFAKRI
jgi:hypothetical protein